MNIKIELNQGENKTPPNIPSIVIPIPKKEKPKEELPLLTIPNKKPQKPDKNLTIVIPKYESYIDLNTTIINCQIPIIKNPNSVIDIIETGFGCSQQVIVDKHPKYKSHLCKENYLGEFKTEIEKALARENLGIYSKEEIDKVVGDILNKNFVTKEEVEGMFEQLDFVDSILKSYANYQIPDDLFEL